MRLTTLLLGLTALCASAAPSGYTTAFSDSTLRLDYQLCGDRDTQHIFLAGMQADSGWAGRRHHLADLPLEGRGQVTMTSAATGDTLYRTSFSSLFIEWIDTDEATVTPRAYEHTVLVPMPKEPVNIDVTLTDPSRRVSARLRHPARPKDILIRRRTVEPTEHRYIHKGGDPERAIDVAILAEGYSHSQKQQFYADATEAVDAILAHEPFASHAADFNFVAVASTADNPDVSHPAEGEWVESVFGSHFDTFYSHRYLTSPHVFAINDALTGIPYEHIIVLVNTTQYGGGGIYNDYTLTSARHDKFRPVVVHEFGHSFGGLADEYFYDNEVYVNVYPLDVEPWERNVTTLTDFTGKWENLIAADTKPGTPLPKAGTDGAPGLYEGGAYVSKGVYRCTPDCRMKTNESPAFCPACRQALNRLIDFMVNE